MTVDSSYPLPLKRKKLTNLDSMEADEAKAKLGAAKEKFGREIRVFETSVPASSSSLKSNSEEPDEFYEFTAEDYYRILATKKEDKYLKTRKIREAEEAARRARITKAVIRIRFPDNHTLEATFHPSETLQSLADFLRKVIARPELPFYIYTTPPKKQMKDLSQDFFSAGFVPGAIVYFAYDVQKGDDIADAKSGPFLHNEVMSLKGLQFMSEQVEPIQTAPEAVIQEPTPAVEERKPADKKPVKPRWLKM